MYEIRTDLALEAREKFEEDNVEIKRCCVGGKESRKGHADLKSRDRDRKRGQKAWENQKERMSR